MAIHDFNPICKIGHQCSIERLECAVTDAATQTGTIRLLTDAPEHFSKVLSNYGIPSELGRKGSAPYLEVHGDLGLIFAGLSVAGIPGGRLTPIAEKEGVVLKSARLADMKHIHRINTSFSDGNAGLFSFSGKIHVCCSNQSIGNTMRDDIASLLGSGHDGQVFDGVFVLGDVACKQLQESGVIFSDVITVRNRREALDRLENSLSR